MASYILASEQSLFKYSNAQFDPTAPDSKANFTESSIGVPQRAVYSSSLV